MEGTRDKRFLILVGILIFIIVLMLSVMAYFRFYGLYSLIKEYIVANFFTKEPSISLEQKQLEELDALRKQISSKILTQEEIKGQLEDLKKIKIKEDKKISSSGSDIGAQIKQLDDMKNNQN